MEKGHMMNRVEIAVSGMNIDRDRARRIANALADSCIKEPEVVAWHDRPNDQISPEIEGADHHTRWHDYGEHFGGVLEIGINGDYDFIFTDAAGSVQPDPERDPGLRTHSINEPV